MSRDFSDELKSKWFMAGFGYRQDIELTPKISVELKVNDALHGKTTVKVVERLKSGNEVTRYSFDCHLAAQAIYRLSHLQARSWRLNATYSDMAEYNASEVRPC